MIKSRFFLSLLIGISITFFCGCSQRKKAFTINDCEEKWAIATTPCPILNTPDYNNVFGGRNRHRLKRDKVQLIREVELVALKDTVFKISGVCEDFNNQKMYKVSTDSYPYNSSKGYFIDSRFVKIVDQKPSPRISKVPSKTMLRYKLLSMVNSTYLWGGNWHEGISAMKDYYPPSKPIYGDIRKGWMFRGVDCSGLIFEASDGYTPRNASSLVKFGEPVHIEGLTPEEIAANTRPFDLLGWRTHVMMILDDKNIIQSRVDYDYDTPGNQSGVRVMPMIPLLKKLMEDYVPVDSYDTKVAEDKKKFVIRRWYKDSANSNESDEQKKHPDHCKQIMNHSKQIMNQSKQILNHCKQAGDCK